MATGSWILSRFPNNWVYFRLVSAPCMLLALVIVLRRALTAIWKNVPIQHVEPPQTSLVSQPAG